MRTPLSDTARLVKDKTDPTTVSADTPYVGLEHVEAHTMRLLGHGHAADVKSTKSVFQAGDVLYGKLRPYLNKVVRPDFDGICSTDFLIFRESPKLDNGYLAYYLNQLWVADQAHQLSNGMELPRVNWKLLSQLPLDYPADKAEQRAITAQIERAAELRFSCDAQLKMGRHAIQQLRKTVLTAACSGGLTTDWRERHPDATTAAEVLANSSLKRRRRSLNSPIEITIPEFPDSYVIATVGQAAQVIEYGTSQKMDADLNDGIPILRMGNIQDGLLDFTDLKYHALDKEIEKLLLHDGDLLFNRTNSPELVGKSAVYHSKQSASFASYLIRVRLFSEVCDPDFACYWINSAWGRAWAHLVKTDGVSQSNINGTKLAAMPIPLPPIEEQQEIVRRASDLLSRADELLSRLSSAERAVERISQAILAKAFRGDLLNHSG